MMISILYKLIIYDFSYYDPYDDEYVEDVSIVGYFTSREKLQDAIEICKKNGVKDNNLLIKAYDIKLSSHQKYIYELSYGYAIYNAENDTYTDYYYNMLMPQKNKKLCLELKKTLLQEEKFAMADYKIYDCEPDGFFIEKYILNKLYHQWPL